MILYEREVYLSLLARYNEALWPAQLLALLLGLLALGLLWRPRRGGDRLVAALLAVAWIWVGAGFFLRQMASIDYAAPLFGWLFVLQGLLLAWRGLLAGRLGGKPGCKLGGSASPAATRIGLGLAAFALLAMPPLAWLLGQPWPALPVFGLTPGATAVFTLGLLVAARGRARWLLAAVPIAWCLLGGFLAWELALPAAYPLPLAGLLGLAALFLTGRRPA